MKQSAGMETIALSAFARSVCAVIVTYYPDSAILDRIQRVARQVGQTLVVDNGSPSSVIESIRGLSDKLTIDLIANPTNEGIARALNAGTRWAASQGFQWVLTLDQDTIVAADMVDTFEAVLRAYPSPACLAVIGSNYRDKVNGKLFFQPTTRDVFAGSKIISVLTSGSLISVDAFAVIGGFRDDFFVDCVDHEYCLHARACGFQVVVTSKPIMEHQIGHPMEHRVLWKKVRTPNQSPLREYFRTRNSIVLIREYLAREPLWMLKYLWAWLKSVVFMFFFERDRKRKFSNIMRGCVDAAFRRTGLPGE
jgi:rhamnosyltransferase